MRYSGIILACVLLGAALPNPVTGQKHRGYVRASVGLGELDTPMWLSVTSVAQPSVGIAFFFAESHALEFGWSRIDTRGHSTVQVIEGPSGALMRSTGLRLAYQYEPTFLRVTRLRPLVTVGAARTWVAHRVITDVLYDDRTRSTAYAMDAAVGLRINAFSHLQVITRAGYRRTERLRTPITPTGAFADLGLATWW